MEQFKKIMFMPDTHIPYHDEKAVNLFYKAVDIVKPDIFVIMGDFADFYSVSFFSKKPNRVNLLDEEVSQVNTHLDYIDKMLPRARKIFLSGNHEDRLERYLTEKAPALFGIISVEKLFQLDRRTNWEYIPYKSHINIGKVFLTHDTGQHGANAHRSARDTFGKTCVIGHTHRIAYEVRNSALGSPHLGAMFGWLGDFGQIEYMHNAAYRTAWSHGFGTGLIDESSGEFHLTPVPIVKMKRRLSCVVNGQILEG